MSNDANTDVFRDKSRAETIVAPKTNIDIMRSSFHKKFTQANFAAVLDATFVAANNGLATVHADYDFVDDVSNKPLETDRAIAARRLEI